MFLDVKKNFVLNCEISFNVNEILSKILESYAVSLFISYVPPYVFSSNVWMNNNIWASKLYVID